MISFVLVGCMGFLVLHSATLVAHVKYCIRKEFMARFALERLWIKKGSIMHDKNSRRSGTAAG